ncbi:MAG: urease accessory UreF family protein [Burkholderiaceae bacterium]
MKTAACFEMMRLASPALPIGGFSYSQGLEAAIDIGWVSDEDSLITWLRDCLSANIGQFEAPLFWALAHAQRRDAQRECSRLNKLYLASRESAELLAETRQMGFSLLRLIAGRTVSGGNQRQAQQLLDTNTVCSLPWAWAIAADALQLNPDQALNAYLWSWSENQIAAAIKAVPLGQQSGQRVMDTIASQLSSTAAQAPGLPADQWSNFAPGFAIASCVHETQYSRLFRS